MRGEGKKKFTERSLVIIKPDGVQRGLIGEIIGRFEKKGLKISAMKMTWPTLDLVKKHYNQPESAMILLGERTLAAYKEKGIEIKKTPIEIAKDIQNKLLSYVVAGPVVAMIIEGAHAIAHVRKIRGNTNPLSADVGSITADLSIDSYFIADEDSRAIRNLVHASGNVEEAEYEISLWFKPEEISDYDIAIDKVLYDPEWESEKTQLIGKN